MLGDAKDIAVEVAKKKIKQKILLAALGFFTQIAPYLLIVIFFGILFGIAFDSEASENNYGMIVDRNVAAECGFTISQSALTKNQFKDKLESFANTNSRFRVFAENAEDMYKYAESKKVNPELIVVRAYVEHQGGTNGANNYWGLNCLNGRESETCNNYSSFKEGYMDFVNVASKYDSLAAMMSKYAYIGYFWYNPGGSGTGGCYYASHIFHGNIPERVKNACSSGRYCSILDNDQTLRNKWVQTGVNPRPECTPTTDEDQLMYSRWQVEQAMAGARKQIFGLEFDDGPCVGGNLSVGESSENGSLKTKINSYLAQNSTSGEWSIYIKNLNTNKTTAISDSTKMIAASEIKLFIMASLYEKVKNNEISESDIVNDVRIMIQNSDNSATNRLIDKYNMSDINKYISSNGYSMTKLNRKMLANNGKENYTSARDIGKLLENIYNRQLVSSTYSDTMLGFLKNQTLRSKIPAGVPNGVEVANKTGELENKVENDAAIVYSEGGTYILVVLSKNISSSNEARTNIREISKIVYEYYN